MSDTTTEAGSNWDLDIPWGFEIFLFLLMLGATIGLYFTRRMWLPIVQHPSEIYTRLGWSEGGSFRDDLESGLTSDYFDLSENITSGDSRAGLDQVSKKAIQKIMKRNPGMTFDEARAKHTKERFRDNGIGADGRPTDPKAVFFS
ncbi:UPF0357 protein [Yarrowia sp. B02]|nr:UPF0357 protein [Yarrowia sp. B02]